MKEGESIYEMELHQIFAIDFGLVTRVPGGWIYTRMGSSVFVPYNSEFEKKERKENGI